MAQHVIGLDIGSWSVKAAVLESSLRGFALVDVAEHHVPRLPTGKMADPDTAAQVSATLRQVTEWEGLSTAVPGRQAMVREVELPFTDDRKIKPVLGFQLEDLLPLDVDDLTFDYVHQEDAGAETATLLCAAVPSAFMAEFLSDLASAEADPKVVTLDTMAYSHLLNHLDEDASEGPVAVVDIGHETTQVSVIEGGKVRTVRTLARGGHHLTLALMNGLELEYGEAEHLKHTSLRLDGHLPPGADEAQHAQLLGLIDKPLRAIFRDIRLTLHAHRSRWRTPVERVICFGGSARMPGMREALGHVLGVAVDRPRISAQTWARLDADEVAETQLPTAIALGLRYIDGGAAGGLNFRQGLFAFESDFKALRDRAGWLALLAVLLLVAFFGRQYVHWEVLEHNHGALVAQLQTFSGQVLGEEKDDFQFVLQRLNMPPEADGDSVFPEMTAFKAFYEITESQHAVNGMRGEVDDSDVDAEASQPPGPREAPTPRLDAARSRLNTNSPASRAVPRPLDPSVERTIQKTRENARMVKEHAERMKREIRSGADRPSPLPISPTVRTPTRPSTRDAIEDRSSSRVPEEPTVDDEGEDTQDEVDDGRFRVELKQIQVDLKQAFIKGEANNIEAVETFTSQLKKNRCFANVETSDTTRLSFGDRQDWLRFQINLELECKSPESETKDAEGGADGAGEDR